jgi:YD repeat-containing protein
LARRSRPPARHLPHGRKIRGRESLAAAIVPSYTNSGLAAGDSLRFALQADATSLATGYYAWSMTVTANYTGSTSSTTYSGYHAVVNRASSEYGKGWWLDGLDRLVTSGSGALLVRGNGDTLWFQDNSGTYAKAAGDTQFSTLVKNGDNTYTLTTKHGYKENFGTTGLLTSRVDPNSNTFTYAYTDGDSDSVSDELYTITDPYSRVLQTVAYSSGRVSTITDVASHATTLAYTSGQLTTVTLTDPDGAGALASPIWSYAYSGTTNLMTTTTDPRSKVESYTYNSTSLRLSRVDTPISGQYTTLVPVQTYGLKTGSGNALVETVNPLGEYRDENANIFKFKLDRFGNEIQFGNDFSGGSTNDVVDTYRDPTGLPYKILQPAIGGTRSQTLLAYNTKGDRVKAIYPEATTQTWTYDSTFHNVLTAVDELARTTTFTYNGTGNELTRADNAGNTWTTSYGSRTDGLPVSITSPDPDGAGSLSAYVTSFAYDSSGRRTTTTNPDSSTTVLAYNSADMVTSYTDELSHVTTYSYDALNRPTSVTQADPDGGGYMASPVTSYTYDEANNRLTQTDPLSKTTDFEYGDRNWRQKDTAPDPDGGGSLGRPETTYTYDSRSNRTGQDKEYYTDSDAFTYDAYRRLTATMQGPVGAHHDYYNYDVSGRMTTHTNSLHDSGTYDQTDSYEYDSRGRITKQTGPDPDTLGPLTRPYELFVYNAAGQPTSHTDFLGNVTSYTYTSAGWLNSVTLPDPDGSGPLYAPIYTYGYDALGNNISMTDPNNHISTKTWDNRGRLASETGADPDGAGGLSAPTTTYAYNNAGLLTSITDPLGKVTSFGYDNLNRRTSLTLPDPDGGGGLSAPVYTFGYNAAGSLTTETDPLGNVTTTAYDNLQRKTSVTQPDPDGGGGLSAPVWTWTYGSSTLATRMTDPLGHNTDYAYDTYGRQTTVTNHEGYVTTTAYNLLDQVTSVTTPDPDGAGGVAASVTTYAYDYLDRLASTTDPLSGVTSFTYDLMGRLTNLRDPVNNDTAWAYDNAGRVTMETNELNNTRSFYHDAAGNLTRKKDRNERVTQYTFDDLDRMTAEKWLTSGDPVPTLAVSTTTQGGPSSEVQRVGFTADMMITSGTFTLSFGGQTTGTIAYDASAATVQTALQGLSTIGSGNVVATKTQSTMTAQEWQVTFQGSLAGTNQNQITINAGSVTAMMTRTDIQTTDTEGGTGSNNEVQVVTLSNATGGEFRLAFAGQTTAPIAYNASAATVDSALEALQSVDTVTTTGSAGGPWTITFTGTHAGTNVAQLQGDAANSSSGSVARTISFTYSPFGKKCNTVLFE